MKLNEGVDTGRYSHESDRYQPSQIWHRSPTFWVSIGLVTVVVAVILAVDIFPIITNDSLAYIGHSNSLQETGLVQFGYRQVGYPAFLAGVDLIATQFRMEPLLLTALAQRFIYLSALAFAAWLWRWRAAPLLALAILPTLLVYTNFILTEGLAIGLVLWYAVLTAWILRLGFPTSGDEIDRRTQRTIVVVGALVGAIYLALLTVRFQYSLAVFGFVAALYSMYRSGSSGRTAAKVVGATVFVLASSFLLVASRENAQEVGPFFPTVRGERSQFWATWQVTFKLTPENRVTGGLTELFAEGNPYTIMGQIDALPTYAEQQTAYDSAINQLIDNAGTSFVKERTNAFIGVLRGGRIDDVQGIVANAAATSFWTIEDSIYRTSAARRQGIKYFVDSYNQGRRIQPILTSPLAPLRTFPYFLSVFRWLLPISGLILLIGITRAPTRLLSMVGLATLLTTATVFGYFLMDNVRFVLIPLLFVVGIATGAVDTDWRHRKYGNDLSIADPIPNT
ncbi:hypothetical protein MNBD_ACTINO02-2312 [hydrothermal vent metagenome]|uniref:Uncharacterized protein n=1 Tax=hydrothermal vent metagenome TaxID=652676 RepID=A0A3B0S9E2_9ZZZZ